MDREEAVHMLQIRRHERTDVTSRAPGWRKHRPRRCISCRLTDGERGRLRWCPPTLSDTPRRSLATVACALPGAGTPRLPAAWEWLLRVPPRDVSITPCHASAWRAIS